MKTTSFSSIAAGVSTLGLLVVLSGCANTPTRVSTLESHYAPVSLAYVDQDVQHPKPLRTVQPFYPIDMRREGITGSVLVNCFIDENGAVRNPVAVEPTDSRFSKPALDALKQWSFQPALRDGEPVAVRASIPIHFTFDP